jgi:uncharacterized phage protein (TIGR02218 family)
MPYYDYIDQSKELASTIYLYQFAQGDLGTYRFTSQGEEVTHAGDQWIPEAISHGEVSVSGEIPRDTLSIKLPRNNEMAYRVLAEDPGVTTSVTIYRGHEATPEDFIVYWRGRVLSAQASKESITLKCESIYTSMKRSGLRGRFQRSCRYSLYGDGCNVDRDAFEDGPFTVAAAAGAVVTVTGADGQVDGYYNAGILQYGPVLRYITSHVGNAITLIRPIEQIEIDLAASPGDVQVSLFPGCDKTRITCNDKFNNLENFGGFPWIPLRNPFGGSSIV